MARLLFAAALAASLVACASPIDRRGEFRQGDAPALADDLAAIPRNCGPLADVASALLKDGFGAPIALGLDRSGAAVALYAVEESGVWAMLALPAHRQWICVIAAGGGFHWKKGEAL